MRRKGRSAALSARLSKRPSLPEGGLHAPGGSGLSERRALSKGGSGMPPGGSGYRRKLPFQGASKDGWREPGSRAARLPVCFA